MSTVGQRADDVQHFVHRSWTVEQGLPQNTVTAIARTTDGYVWLGTVKGVVRFDGVRFVAFERATTPGLADDRVTKLLATSSGDLWIGTEWGGVGLRSKGMFTSYLGDGGVSEHYISSLFEDRHGNVWIGAANVAYQYDGDSFERFQFAAPDSPDSPRSFLETRDGRLLVSGQGVFQFTGDGFRAVEMHGLDVGTVVYDMREAEGGSLWLATSKGIVHSTPTRSRTYAFGSEPVTVLAVGKDGLLWAGVRGQGLARFDGESWAIERRLGFIRHLYPDEDGLIWVAGGDDGLHRLQPALFRTITEIGAPGGESVLRVVEDKHGAIWTGSLYAGMFRSMDGSIRQFTTKDGLPGNSTHILSGDREGSIWMAAGSQLYGFKGERFEPVDLGAEANPYGSTAVRAVAASSRGGLWLGMPGLIARFDGRGLSDQVALPEHPGINHTHLHEDSAGNVWISADRGRLCRISSGVPTCLGREEGIPPHVVRDVHENPDGSHWFGTY
ncbi:MAG TPA: two-component regulator propeller domain-containing protein, partial [Rhodothermia bacterium]|nr:two-component regulator propeller domain-containing protein [Rhodothermia bacterium]